MNCLLHLTEKLPVKYFMIHYIDILHALFLGIQKIPEVIKLSIFDEFKALLKKLAEMHKVPVGTALTPLQTQLLINVSELLGRNIFI